MSSNQANNFLKSQVIEFKIREFPSLKFTHFLIVGMSTDPAVPGPVVHQGVLIIPLYL